MPSLYLAGPMLGLTSAECGDWRAKVTLALKPEIDCFSPMRGKEYLLDLPIGRPEHPNGTLTTPQALVARDRHDCTTCDAVLFNLLDAKEPSIGTSFEFAWADFTRRPSIVIIQPKGNPMDHPFIRATGNFFVETLEEGIAIARLVLLP